MSTVIGGPCSRPVCPDPVECIKGCLLPADTTPPALPEPSGVVHIAGTRVQIGPLLRQRCAWCGVVLVDYNVDNLAVPLGQDPTPATWPEGDLVLVDGWMSTHVPHVDGEDLPPNACGSRSAEATQ